ncbi:tetratricopeptide repeat protein [Uliginosibacterium sp. TH139]|uniref:tetratricopeptide repeat protein n=1 Tax=Uliginosibacterium sp. TH139 TaxID=2067453 RepID=UPI000C797383|nr:tetratricopeptide repeat protein [Uliginosibacterium sp. TH139]PLK46972.1 hypothetical protein C0V76_19130 [Uliginosibacterium sp. TH139]
MNDIELAARVSPAVAELLAIAKEAIEDYPEHCLVKLRAMCKLVCQEIVKAKKLAVLKNGDLADLIAKIVEQLKPDDQTQKALHVLRVWGNKGAHTEENPLTAEQFTELAHKALNQSVTALRFAHQQLHPSTPLPSEIETTPIGGGLKSLCYKATIDENADAQYLIGMRFLRDAEAQRKDFYDPDNRSEFRILGDEYHDALEKSRFWFKFASMTDHPGALYEYGRALAEGKEGGDFKYMGLNNIHRAATKGDANANNFVGNLYYKGLYDYELDYAEARSHFELAAEEDHPEALIALAEMYRLGKGVSKDPKAAFEYTKRSAEAGYPKAQFNLYEYYKSGIVATKDEEQAIHWLKSSADQKFWPAMYQLGEYIVQGKISGNHPTDAEELFRRCLNSVDIEMQFADKAELYIVSIRMLSSPSFNNISEAVLTIQAVLNRSDSTPEEIRELAWSVHENADELLRKLINEQGVETPEGHVSKIFLDSFVTNTTSQIREARQEIAYRKRLEAQSLLPAILQNRPSRSRPIQKAGPVKSNARVGRNDLCPCGTGKKYKYCHGK